MGYNGKISLVSHDILKLYCFWRPMTDAEAELLFLAIDRAEVQQVGITRLASLELNNLHRAPWCFGGSSLSTTLLDFAAWRGRDTFSCQLIAAGADPSEGEAGNVWEKLPRAYVAWLARAAARLRRQVAAESVCVCGKMASMLFLPCGHANCASCIWRQFENFHFGPLPELLCARCNATFDDPSMTFLAQRRGVIRRDPTSKSESNQICAGCGCLNIARAILCINCGWTLSQPRFAAPKASPSAPPSCFDWLIQQMVGKKSRYSVRERQERKLQSLERWKELPEEMQASQTVFVFSFLFVLPVFPEDVEFAKLQDRFGVAECFSLSFGKDEKIRSTKKYRIMFCFLLVCLVYFVCFIFFICFSYRGPSRIKWPQYTSPAESSSICSECTSRHLSCFEPTRGKRNKEKNIISRWKKLRFQSFLAIKGRVWTA